METSLKDKINFHWEALPKETKKAMDFLSTQTWIGQAGWYLAGGTALALAVGHRTSVDLDFFTSEKNFAVGDVVKHFEGNKDWHADIEKESTIYGKLFGCKVSFIAYPFFIPKQDPFQYGNVRVLPPKDIAVMKIIAISQRGKKRDFFDLFWIAKNLENLKEILLRLKDQYPSVAHDYHHILKSLVYFDDAEQDPSPVINFTANWEDVKTYFEKQIPILVNELM